MEEVWLGSRVLQPRRELMAGGERLPIGKRALDILSVLAEARGRIVTKDELFEAVWSGVVVEENALQAHIATLRKALGPDADRLKTIRGIGYQLDIDPEADADLVPPGPSWANGGFAEIPRHNGNGALLEAGNSAHAIPARRAALISRGVATSPKVRWPRLGLAAALVLVVLLIGWAIAEFRPGSRDPIQVVVRPLTSGSGGQTETGLANGITDELIVRLRHVPELRIATAGKDGRVPSDAFEDAYVVEGSIRSSGDRLRVTTRLLDADGAVLWSQTFDRPLVDLFEVQEAMAASIANTLKVSFEVGADSVRYGGTDNPEAYAAYMQYVAHELDFDQTVALGHLERAVQLDPNFVKALFGLAVNYHNQMGVTASRAEADRWLAKQDEVTARALAARPDLWIGQKGRAVYYLDLKDLPAAERYRQRARELDTGVDPELRTYSAQLDMNFGRVQRGAAIRQSRETIDPIYRNDPWKVFDLMMLGRYQESIDLYERLSRAGQGNLQGFTFHAFYAYLLLGREADAFRFAERQGFADWKDQLRSFEGDNAWLAMSDAELKQAFAGQGHFGAAGMGLFAAYAGHPELAVKLMRLAFEQPGGGAQFYLWHPVMAEARKTDAFQKLVMDSGFVKLWRESGVWGDYCRPVSATEIRCA